MTTPTIPAEVAAASIATEFTLLFAALRASIVQQLLVIWYGLSEYSDVALEDWLEVVLPLVIAGEETSSSATWTYMNLQMESLGIEDAFEFPDFSELTGAALRNGARPEDVYIRPFKEAWTALSNGLPFDQAVDMGAQRLRSIVETDIQLAHTHTSRSLLAQRNDVVGFRRVPTGDFTCALCMIASTQRYRKFDLMPIHPGCDCRVAPIISDEPVGQILDPDLLEQIHASVENMFGFSDRSGRVNDYRKLLVVHDHGEYGPTLAKAGNRFTIL